jgi:hypothetical protein
LNIRISRRDKGEKGGCSRCGNCYRIGWTGGKPGSVYGRDGIIVGCLRQSGCVYIRCTGGSCYLGAIPKYFISNHSNIIRASCPVQVDLVRCRSGGRQTRCGSRRGGIRSVPMTCPRSRVCKCFPCFWHKLPIVIGGMQRQLEHTKRIDIAALTVCSNGRNRSMVGTPTPNDEFPHSTGRVKNSVGCLRSKPFIDVVMATQDKVHIIIVQGLPDGLHIR